MSLIDNITEKLQPTMMFDSQTKRRGLRITAFTDNLQDAMTDFQDWMRLNNLTQKDIWYADVFALPSDEHTHKLEYSEDGSVLAYEVANSEVSPYNRNRFVSWLKGWK